MASGEPVRIRELVEALGVASGRPDLLRIGARPANPAEPAVLTATGGACATRSAGGAAQRSSSAPRRRSRGGGRRSAPSPGWPAQRTRH